ncbi:hypothetical protein GDO81_004842 [Engystomops pustulosus]|uniref:Uncharacterized protein n=1 Tax=Engystomops pustulosus TaxID=76066 RepID=A0AAV7CK22_ENGPU|nr:hypothetical protein GDO81_004842 [Engystomops pustulosus]
MPSVMLRAQALQFQGVVTSGGEASLHPAPLYIPLHSAIAVHCSQQTTLHCVFLFFSTTEHQLLKASVYCVYYEQ